MGDLKNSPAGGTAERESSWAQAAELDKKSNALYREADELSKEARRLRDGPQFGALITPSRSKKGRFEVLVMVDGYDRYSEFADSAEDACQIALHVINGFQPPLPLTPFGSLVDRTRPLLGTDSGKSQ
jgi:hypothetical protein